MPIKEIMEILEENEQVFIEHINRYGFNKQLVVLIEELTELLKPAIKILRAQQNNEDTAEYEYNFTEEIIDVLIMLKQFDFYIDDTLSMIILQEKIQRAKKRVNLQ